MIKLNNIEISYDRVLLENGSMQIPDKTLTLITGLSGTGKSTLLYRVGMISDQCDYGYEINGKTIDLRDEESVEKGWVLICVDNYPLGFGKAAGGSVKNKYLAGWRWM